MNRVLVDTSVWIDALNGKKTHHVKHLQDLIAKDIPVVLCPIIIQEILQGIKDDKQFNEVKDTLSGFELLHIDPLETAHGAAQLYRSIRKKGITVRKSNDCLIAYFAIHHGIKLLHNDKDFDKIAKQSSLKIFKSH